MHVVKTSTSSNAAAATSSSSTSKQFNPWGEEKELIDGSKVFGKWYDKMVMMNTSVSFKVNGQQVVKIEQFRSVLLP